MKLYIVENWLHRVDKNTPKDKRSLEIIKNILGDIQIHKDITGKPYIPNASQYINWSHNEKYLVIALSESGQIGVDVEESTLQYNENLYGWVLSEGEKTELAKGRLFAEIWTRKEAIVKCTGEGISEKMCEMNSYEIENLTVTTIFWRSLCISVCSCNKEENLYIVECLS